MTLLPVTARVLAALCCCLLCIPVTAAAKSAHPTARPSLRPIAPEAVYARRALRRARLIIEMRMLEFRKERLECVRQAILRNLPPELRPGEGSKGARRLNPETCAELLR